MTNFEPLHPLFGVIVGDVDLTGPLADDVFAEIRAAFEKYSLLVFHDQPVSDDRAGDVRASLNDPVDRNQGNGRKHGRHDADQQDAAAKPGDDTEGRRKTGEHREQDEHPAVDFRRDRKEFDHANTSIPAS